MRNRQNRLSVGDLGVLQSFWSGALFIIHHCCASCHCVPLALSDRSRSSNCLLVNPTNNLPLCFQLGKYKVIYIHTHHENNYQCIPQSPSHFVTECFQNNDLMHFETNRKKIYVHYLKFYLYFIVTIMLGLLLSSGLHVHNDVQLMCSKRSIYVCLNTQMFFTYLQYG